jgi:hypothetical protein
MRGHPVAPTAKQEKLLVPLAPGVSITRRDVFLCQPRRARASLARAVGWLGRRHKRASAAAYGRGAPGHQKTLQYEAQPRYSIDCRTQEHIARREVKDG